LCNGNKPVNELNGEKNKIYIFEIIKWSWGFSGVINTIHERMKQEKWVFGERFYQQFYVIEHNS